MFLASCDTQRDRDEPHQTRVQLNPTVLDFGRVRATERPLALESHIENKSSQRLLVEKVLPSCGCTLCDLPSDTIPPKGSVAVCIKVFLKGRSGDFEQDVFIRIVGEEAPLILPIRGYVDDNLSFSSQTIRCTADAIDRVAEAQFDVVVKNLSDVDFDTVHLPVGVVIEEISREPTQEGFVLRMFLRIQVPADQDSHYFDLVLQPTSVDVLPLVIPVQCFIVE